MTEWRKLRTAIGLGKTQSEKEREACCKLESAWTYQVAGGFQLHAVALAVEVLKLAHIGRNNTTLPWSCISFVVDGRHKASRMKVEVLADLTVLHGNIQLAIMSRNSTASPPLLPSGLSDRLHSPGRRSWRATPGSKAYRQRQ